MRRERLETILNHDELMSRVTSHIRKNLDTIQSMMTMTPLLLPSSSLHKVVAKPIIEEMMRFQREKLRAMIDYAVREHNGLYSLECHQEYCEKIEKRLTTNRKRERGYFIIATAAAADEDDKELGDEIHSLIVKNDLSKALMMVEKFVLKVKQERFERVMQESEVRKILAHNTKE
jgi:hypothetical protein